MWLAIGIISSIDIYWSIINQNVLGELEENPIGRYLIEISDGSVALFMSVKVAGTIIALGVLFFVSLEKKVRMANYNKPNCCAIFSTFISKY
jgi:hypothetical protein